MSETVLVDLNWTFGVNTPAGVRYFGPGRVPVPGEIARRMGWKPVEVEGETAVSDPVGAPTPEQGEQVDYPVADVADAAGVGRLTDALIASGFVLASHIVQADEAALTAVPGIGKPTAAKLWSAAQELLAQESME